MAFTLNIQKLVNNLGNHGGVQKLTNYGSDITCCCAKPKTARGSYIDVGEGYALNKTSVWR